MRLQGHGKGDLALNPVEGSGWGRWPLPSDCVRRDPDVGGQCGELGTGFPAREAMGPCGRRGCGRAAGVHCVRSRRWQGCRQVEPGSPLTPAHPLPAAVPL